jgi:hypothetical protein
MYEQAQRKVHNKRRRVIEDIKEYKMKKLLAILMVLVLVSGALFAAAEDTGLSDSMTITTTVIGVQSIKLSTEPLAVNGWTGSDLTTFGFTSTTAEAVPEAQSGYVNLRTNNRLGYYIVVTALPLKSSTVTTEIGYSLVPNTNKSTDATSGPGITLIQKDGEKSNTLVTFAASNAAGMRVSYQGFTVALTDDDWKAATSSDDYTTTVTFALWTN